MASKRELLFANNWTVRISDPGEEGAHSHLFETTYVTLEAEINQAEINYLFTRKTEDKIEIQQTFTDLKELFKFVADYMDAVSLGLLGVKIGQLTLQ
ncbi:DUF5377 family protein [Conservatibacter flavescens]|uniref:Dithiol-disulfide isomerase n=1 Tax=Conservatibacter flavescens TaxID=28161 RepID=A0A2M8S3A6_9PAST|nr:DUF5377 family protein [Conservatibacter flavescens]PJG85634.1 dithiol-disulfide isomerase [Conservatibacter flavescens]